MKLIKIIILLVGTSAISQESLTFREDSYTNRKGKFYLSVGSDYRITPIYRHTPLKANNGITNIDLQNSGTTFNYSLDYYISNNFCLGFSQSFRYDLLIYNDDKSFDYGARKAEKTLILDYTFYFKYYINITKENKLFVKFGQSMMNRGTDYTIQKSLYDSSGNLLGNSFSEKQFNYGATNFGIGYNKKKIDLFVGIYSTSNTEYFETSQNVIIPYLSLSYQAFKL